MTFKVNPFRFRTIASTLTTYDPINHPVILSSADTGSVAIPPRPRRSLNIDLAEAARLLDGNRKLQATFEAARKVASAETELRRAKAALR